MKYLKKGRVVVSVLILFLMTVCAILVLVPAKAEPLDTYHSDWALIRETADEDGANFAAVYALATSEGNFASKNSSSVVDGGAYRIRSYAGNTAGNETQTVGAAWEFAISASTTDADDDSETFSFNIIGWSRNNGMLQVLAEGAGAIGTQDVVLYPNDGAAATDIWWADTITLDETTKWNTVSVLNSGDNEVAILHVDMAGLEWVQFVIYDANGSGAEAGDLTVFGRPY